MPLDADLADLKARRLELEVGLNLLKERIEQDKKAQHDVDIAARLKANAAAVAGAAPVTSTTGKPQKETAAAGHASPAKGATKIPVSSAKGSATIAVAGKAVDGDAHHSEQNHHHAVQEEKMKRVKAEVALQQQKNAMAELQNQLFDLKEAEQRQLAWRYEATINRLPEDEKHRAQQHVEAIGKQTVGPLKGLEDLSATAKKAKEDHQLSTTITKAVAAGDTRLPVASQEGFKKGMRVVIGAGTTMEMRTVTGFGSLIIDKALTFDHPANTVVLGYPSSVKLLPRIEKMIAREFCRGIICEEIFPAVIADGEKRALAHQLNALYYKRPMVQHAYTAQTLAPLRLGDAPCSALAFASSSSKILAAVGGKLRSFEFRLGAVELVGLFESLAKSISAVPVKGVELTSSVVDDAMIKRSELISTILDDSSLRGGFQLLAESRQATSVAELLLRGQSTELDEVSWKTYFAVVQGRSLKRKVTISLEQLGYSGDLDAYSFSLLLRLFDMFDCDEDECITGSEVQTLFAELDGCLPDAAAFNDSVRTVMGSQAVDLKFSLKEFLALREHYSKALDTLAGGIFLHGKCQIHATVESLTVNDRATEVKLSPYELSRAMPSAILYKQHLPRKVSLSMLLENDSLKRPVAEILQILSADMRFFDRRVSHQTLDCNGGAVGVVQVLLDYTGRLVYALVDNGVVHVFEAQTGSKLYEQRVMWAEPLSARSVEGNERFSKWRKDSGLEHDNNTPDMHLNSIECTRISSLLARFSLSLPAAAGSSSVMSIDPVSGLVAVNCSVVSGSICFFEPTALKRIFRIKSPSKFSADLSDAIHGLTFGKLPKMDMFRAQHCNGAVTSMVVNSHRCLIFCQIAGSHNLSIMSLLTGDVIMELSGHTDAISCFSSHTATNLLFTGSEDRSVRVWKTAECIPPYLAITGAMGDHNTRRLEHKITHTPTVGAGSSRVLRNLYTHLCARLRVLPRWRRGVVVSFFDGHKYVLDAVASQHTAAVEVVFENATVQLFATTNALRDVKEIDRAPDGPPLWSEHSALLAVGKPVAVYDVDPDILSVVLARELGVQSTAALPYERCKTLLESLFAVSIGFDVTEVSLALEAVGYQATDGIQLSSFLHRLYKQQERYYAMSDRFLVGNAAPVMSIRLSETSKLLMAIDRTGCCCVWDPCSSRAFMSISDPFSSLCVSGPFAYALVACQNLGSSVHFSEAAHPTLAYEPSIFTMPIPADCNLPFPVDRVALARAYQIDAAHVSAEEDSVRGFIYVLKDFTHVTVETACFLPSMVCIENPSAFMHVSSLLGVSGPANLQSVFARKESILRIIYVVSESHTEMHSLATDLNKYGVITRGYNTTPSDRIELVCFERDADWYARIQRVGNVDPNAAVNALASRSLTQLSGFVIGVSYDQFGRREYKVAVNFSNEICTVQESKILRCEGKTVTLSPGAKPVPIFSALHGYCMGALIEFVDDSLAAKNVDGTNSLGELNSVVMRVTNDVGETCTYLVPIVIGRSSFPVLASAITASVSEHTKKCLANAYEARMKTLVGRLTFHSYLHHSSLSSWRHSAQLHNLAMLKDVATLPLDVADTLQARSQTLKGDSKRATTSSLLSVFGGGPGSFMRYVVQQAISLLQLRVASTHPFVAFLEDALGHVGERLVAAYRNKNLVDRSAHSSSTHNDHVRWGDFLDQYTRKWLVRKGVTVEEIFHSGVNEYVTDVEQLNYRLQKVLISFHSHDKHSVGQAVVSMMPLLLSKAGLTLSAKDAASKQEKGALSLIDCKNNLLKVLLVQHQASVGLRAVDQVSTAVKDEAVQILCRELDSLMKPITMAVRATISAANVSTKISSGASLKRKTDNRVAYRRDKPASGQYAISSKVAVESTFPGISVHIYTASRTRGGDTSTERFLVWNFLGGSDSADGDLVAAVSHIPHLANIASRDARIVRTLDGVSFEAESEAPCMIFEWSDKWRSLAGVVKSRGGFLHQGKLELLRIISTNILDALADLHSADCMLKALAPDHIMLDENGLDVLLMLLPTAVESAGEEDATERANRMCNNFREYTYNNPMISSCFPRTDAESARYADLYPAQWDTWSFGACLFTAAFGISPFQFQDGNPLQAAMSEASQSVTTGSLLYQLLQPVLESRLRLSGNKEVPGTFSSTHSGVDFAVGAAISETLKSVLAEKSKDILFRMVSEYTGRPVDHVTAFRASFCEESLTCGLTEWSTGALWEKIVQCIFVRIHAGMHEVSRLKDKIATLPKALAEETATAFLADEFGLALSKAELEALVSSLSVGVGKTNPAVERLSRMFKTLSVALEQIFYYGVFQQLLYIICACFSVEPTERPKLSELRSLAFFDSHNESSWTKASREALLLMTPFHNAEEFYSIALLKPMRGCLQRLAGASAVSTRAKSGGGSAWKVRSDLELFSTCLSLFEDLISGITSEAVGKSSSALGVSLEKTGADLDWLRDNSLVVANFALEQGFLAGVAMFLLRFLGTDYAKNLDTQRGSLTMKETASIRGISLGSKLAARVSKFLQHMVSCLAAMSSQMTAMQLSTASVPNEELLLKLKRRKTMDWLFNSTLTSLLMLYAGEESPVVFAGSYHSDLTSAHPAWFPAELGSQHTSIDSRWNAQMCKLFEPSLIDIVGEDGTGSNKVAVSTEMIKNADKLMNNYIAAVALSFPRAGIVAREHCLPALYDSTVQSRGSFYFVGLIRYVRSICVMEAASAKTNERTQQGIIAAVILLLPTPNVSILKPIETAEEATQVETISRYIPDGQWWQKIQVLLDARCGARLQANFSSNDVTTKVSLLKLCQRVFSVCLSLPGELMESEPFLSLGKDFSSAGWVHGISELLKSKVTNLELSVNAIICLRLMAHRAAFMRSWSVFQVMPILCVLARYPGRDYSTIRFEAHVTLKYATANLPASTQAMITLRLPNLESVQGLTQVTPVVNLLIEANDISFGSTLAEQKRFSESTIEWMNSVFPAEVPYSMLTQHNFAIGDPSRWETLFDLASQVISWVPKLCLALVVTDAQDSAKREKTQISCAVATKQLQIVERILLYALCSNHPGAAACVVRCLWSAATSAKDYQSSDSNIAAAMSIIESQTCGNGLISCIDQLTSTGTFIDTFLSLRLQFTIMHIICRLMKYGGSEILHLMCSCGIVRTIDKFLLGAFAVMKEVPRLSQQGLFAKQYKDMISCLREVWSVVVGTRDSRVYEDILDLGLFQKLIQEWLPSAVIITFGNIDPDYNPLVIRVEALRMIQTLVVQIPASERLVAELVRWVMVSDTLRKELGTLRSTSTKKGSAGMKKLAAEVLGTLASISAEVMDQELLVSVFIGFGMKCIFSIVIPILIYCRIWEYQRSCWTYRHTFAALMSPCHKSG